MKLVCLCLVAVSVVLFPSVALCQEPAGGIDPSFERYREAWREAWSRRDVETLGTLMTEDVDWVTSTGRWLKGREAWKQHHVVFFAQQFQNATATDVEQRVQMIGPDMLFTISVNRNEGETFPDGSPRLSRSNNGLRVFVRQEGRWLLKLAHNTILTPPATGATPAAAQP